MVRVAFALFVATAAFALNAAYWDGVKGGEWAVDDWTNYSPATQPGTALDDYVTIVYPNRLYMNGETATLPNVSIYYSTINWDLGAGHVLNVISFNNGVSGTGQWGRGSLTSGTLNCSGDFTVNTDSTSEPDSYFQVIGAKFSAQGVSVGFNLAKNRFEVLDGGVGTVKRLTSGVYGRENVIRIDGEDSQMTIAADCPMDEAIAVGQFGSDNAVYVTDGAVLSNLNAKAFFIGMNEGAVGNLLCVSNASLIAEDANLRLGHLGGSSNRVEFLDGAKVTLNSLTSGNFYNQEHAHGIGNVVRIDGVGTEVSAGTVVFGDQKSSGGRMRISDGAKVSTGSLYVGTEGGSADNEVRVSGTGTLSVDGNVLIGMGGSAGQGNALVLDGAKMVYDPERSTDQGFLIGNYAPCSRFELVNGAEFTATNRIGTKVVRMSWYGSSFTNVFAIRSGSIARVHGLDVGYNGVGNRLELENGTFHGVTDGRTEGGPGSNYLVFGRNVGTDGELVIKGSNSYLRSTYMVTGAKTRFRFDIPAEGYVGDHPRVEVVAAYFNELGSIEVNVDENFTKGGTFTLMKWESDTSDGTKIPAENFHLNSPKVKARFIVSQKQVDVKVSSDRGMMLILR